MTDLEIMRLCAEAMDIPADIFEDRGGVLWIGIIDKRNPGNGGEYCPLTNDAQAMALLKKFIRVIVRANHGKGDWQLNLNGAANADLNRAICECVAQMRRAGK